MYKRILVPVDGSSFSQEMIPYATGIAAAHGTPITLLRVAESGSLEPTAEEELRQIAAPHGAGHLCTTYEGDPADAILREAQRVPDTLVAMTSRGHSGLAEAVLGSVAMRVVRGSAAPVLLYHPRGEGAGTEPVKVGRVLLPLDGSDVSEAMGTVAAKFAKWLGAELMVVGVIDPKDLASVSAASRNITAMEGSYVRTRARELAAAHQIEVNWDTLHGPQPAEEITQYLAGSKDTVLAMATRGRSAMKSAFLGSVTAGCLRKSGVPVLTQVP